MPIQRPAMTTATGRKTRHIAVAADQSCRASSFTVAAMIRSSRLGVSSSMTFTNPASFLCCSVSVAILVFCASTAARIEVNSSIVSGLPSCCCDYSSSFCCFSLSSAALMFLLLLLLVVVKERLRALWGEVRREGARALAALGAAGPPRNGGNGVIRGTTRRRHAANQLLMLQNPHRSQPRAPRRLQDLGAGPIGAKELAQHRPSSSISAKKFSQHSPSSGSSAKKFSQHSPFSGSSAKKFSQQAQKRRFWGVLSVQGELFRAHVHHQRSSPVEWCNRFVSFGVGYALSWSVGSSCWVGWGVSRDLVRMSRLR